MIEYNENKRKHNAQKLYEKNVQRRASRKNESCDGSS